MISIFKPSYPTYRYLIHLERPVSGFGVLLGLDLEIATEGNASTLGTTLLYLDFPLYF